MKRIRHTRLLYQDGSSDKVYEADLLQLSETEYLVNFRYGKRGASLREGTKTNQPAAFEAAAKIYKSLLVSKMNKGYEHESGFDPFENELQAPPLRATRVSAPERILERLRLFAEPSPPVSPLAVNGAANGTDYIQGHRLSRTVWQAMQYKLTEAADLLVPFVGSDTVGSDNLSLNYSLTWALGKLGTERHLPALAKLQTLLPANQQYLAQAADWALTPASQRLQELQAQSPEHVDLLLAQLKAYARYEPLYVNEVSAQRWNQLQQVLQWREIAEPVQTQLQATPIEQEWPEFLAALPANVRETIESDQQRYADLREALNQLVKDWLHQLKAQLFPQAEADQQRYAEAIKQVDLRQVVSYSYYDNSILNGFFNWIYEDILTPLATHLKKQLRMTDADALLKRLQDYHKYQEIPSQALSESDKQSCWQVLEAYGCAREVREAFADRPLGLNLSHLRNRLPAAFAARHLPPELESQYRGHLKPELEALFYGHRYRLKAELMQNRQADRTQFESAILNLFYLARSAKTQQALRRTLITRLETLPFSTDTFPLIRKLLKLAEFFEDAELLALLNLRIETTPALNGGFSYYGKDNQHPFTTATRHYLRRRMLRLLKSTARHQPQNYPLLAAEILKRVPAAEPCFAARTETISRYFETNEGYQLRTRKLDYPAFSNHLALGYIFWQGSRCYQLDKKGLKWLSTSGAPAEVERPEAHADLWDQAPQVSLEVLLQAKAERVNDFVLALLQRQAAFCEHISQATWLSLLARPFENTALFALAALRSAGPLPELLETCLNSDFGSLRSYGLDFLSESLLSQHPALLANLLCSPYAEVQAALQQYVELYPSLEAGFADQMIQALLRLAAQTDKLEPRLPYLQNWLKQSFFQVSLAGLQGLFATEVLSLQLLALELLEASDFAYSDLLELIAQMQSATAPEIQAGALRLMAKLPTQAQLKLLPSFLDHLFGEQTAFRQAAARLLNNLASSAEAGQVWQALYPRLFESSSEAIATDILELAKAYQAQFRALPAEQVWQLLTARNKLAQQVGGQVIVEQSAAAFDFKQLLQLSKNANLQARQWALTALQTDGRGLANLDQALELLDNPWADSRQAALSFFQSLDPVHWTPERVVMVCDQVYPEVEAWGRELVTAQFEAGHVELYLRALSQHPSRQMQLFVSGFLASKPFEDKALLLSLEPFFQTVLSRVNQGRVLKDRVLRLLQRIAEQDRQLAEMSARLLSQHALSTVVQDRAVVLEALLALQAVYPDLETPLQSVAPRKHTNRTARKVAP